MDIFFVTIVAVTAVVAALAGLATGILLSLGLKPAINLMQLKVAAQVSEPIFAQLEVLLELARQQPTQTVVTPTASAQTNLATHTSMVHALYPPDPTSQYLFRRNFWRILTDDGCETCLNPDRLEHYLQLVTECLPGKNGEPPLNLLVLTRRYHRGVLPTGKGLMQVTPSRIVPIATSHRVPAAVYAQGGR